jgi:N-acetylglucosaminyl-diphospho-decaprenol L-rhamnosyltransferase
VVERALVDVVIVSHRSRDLLRDCLLSLRAHAPSRPTRVHVVDNASEDGTVEMLLADFPDVVLTPNAENLGFSAANNLAIRAGSGEYVLALNPDSRLSPGALDRLLDLMDAHPEIGIAGPRLERVNGTLDHAAKRSFPTPLSALGHFTGVGRLGRGPSRLRAYRAPDVQSGPVDAVNGAFMLMRRRALEEVGLFDEGYWMYMEDLDLCYRFAQAGWLTWYEPSVTVTHVKRGSTGRHRATHLNWAFHRGMGRFYRKHYAPAHNTVFNALVYVGIAAKLMVSLVHSAAARGAGAAVRGPRRSA